MTDWIQELRERDIRQKWLKFSSFGDLIGIDIINQRKRMQEAEEVSYGEKIMSFVLDILGLRQQWVI